jgi:hypothetical protein
MQAAACGRCILWNNKLAAATAAAAAAVPQYKKQNAKHCKLLQQH